MIKNIVHTNFRQIFKNKIANLMRDVKFNKDFEYKNEPDETTPDEAENANIGIHNTWSLKQDLNADNAGAHNSIYRGKDITELFYDGTVSKNIANGTFEDIFIGDYIIGKTSKRKYLVADINYELHKGNVDLKTPHVLMVPETTLGSEKMNSENIVTGAYVGSEFRRTNLEKYKTIIINDFGEDHILTYQNHLQNAVKDNYESGGTWYMTTIELMNELMVFGTNIFHNVSCGENLPNAYAIDTSQLSLFRLDKSKIGGNRQAYWLRGVASSKSFCGVGSGGNCAFYDASTSVGIRPFFLIY